MMRVLAPPRGCDILGLFTSSALVPSHTPSGLPVLPALQSPPAVWLATKPILASCLNRPGESGGQTQRTTVVTMSKSNKPDSNLPEIPDGSSALVLYQTADGQARVQVRQAEKIVEQVV